MREIVNAMAKRTCVVFAGAGLSRNAGLPGWSELASFLVTSLLKDGKIKEHFEPPIKAMLEQNKLSECMELMLLASSRRDILSRMRGALKPQKDSEAHAVLKKLQLRGYITTNYDRLLEDVCESTCYRLTNSLEKLSLVPTALGRPGVQFILKLHGDMDDESAPDHNEVTKGGPFIVLSKTDYTVMLQGDRGIALKLALHSVLQEAPILFLGYTYGDPDISLALDFLAKNCQFPHQSWFVTLTGQTVPNLPQNITLIQPFSDWSQLPNWLNGLLAQVQAEIPVTPSASTQQYEVSERDRKALLALGEYVYGLETDNLFSKTIVSILVPELRVRDSITKDWLSHFIGSLLDLGPNWADAFAEAVLSELVEMNLVQFNRVRETFVINSAQINALYQKANSEWQEERTKFNLSIAQRLDKSGLKLDPDLSMKLDQILQSLCMEYGHSMAEWIHRGIGKEMGLPDIANVVSQYFAEEENRRKIEELLRLVFADPAEREISYIYRLLSSAFLLNSVKLDPTASKFVQEEIAHYHLYLDSNVLLPLIVKEHSNHNWVASLISMTQKAGVSLYVIEDFLEEVQGHRRLAEELYEAYRNDEEGLGLYGSVSGQRGNCFIEGYLNSAQKRGTKWADFIRNYNDKRIESGLRDAGIHTVKVSVDTFNPSDYGEVLDAIEGEWEKRFRGAKRNRALNRHEAKQFLQVYEQRARQTERGHSGDVWFLSSETVLEKVFLRAPQKWEKAPTFPLSAWATFIDSRMAFHHDRRKHVLSAILQGNSTAYSLPASMAVVRKKLFGSKRVLSKEEYDSLKFTFSGGNLVSRLEKTRDDLQKRSFRNPDLIREYCSIQQSIEAEVKSDLSEKIEASSIKHKTDQAKIDQLTKRIVELERANKPKRKKR